MIHKSLIDLKRNKTGIYVNNDPLGQVHNDISVAQYYHEKIRLIRKILFRLFGLTYVNPSENKIAL